MAEETKRIRLSIGKEDATARSASAKERQLNAKTTVSSSAARMATTARDRLQ